VKKGRVEGGENPRKEGKKTQNPKEVGGGEKREDGWKEKKEKEKIIHGEEN